MGMRLEFRMEIPATKDATDSLSELGWFSAFPVEDFQKGYSTSPTLHNGMQQWGAQRRHQLSLMVESIRNDGQMTFRKPSENISTTRLLDAHRFHKSFPMVTFLAEIYSGRSLIETVSLDFKDARVDFIQPRIRWDMPVQPGINITTIKDLVVLGSETILFNSYD